MEKIHLINIREGSHNHPGFDEKGCLGCACQDACCRHGADFDTNTINLVKENWKELKNFLEGEPDSYFETPCSEDSEYLGKGACRSKVIDGACAFHNKEGRGCILFSLAIEKKLPWRAVPSICRLYPLTWSNGELFIDPEIEEKCSCNLSNIKEWEIRKPIIETQKEHIEDIFLYAKEPKVQEYAKTCRLKARA